MIRITAESDLPGAGPAAARPRPGGPVGAAPDALPRHKFSQGEVNAAMAACHAVPERHDAKVAIGASALRAARKHLSGAASPARSRAPPAAINSGDSWAIGCACLLRSGVMGLLEGTGVDTVSTQELKLWSGAHTRHDDQVRLLLSFVCVCLSSWSLIKCCATPGDG